MRSSTRVLGALTWPAARTATRIGQGGLTLVGWHRIDRGPTGLSTTFDDFRRHLDVLEERGCVVLPLLSAARLLASGDLPDRAVALTFDDGYRSVLDRAWPELLRRGMPATLFAVPGYLDQGRPFPWDVGAGPEDDTEIASSAALVEAAGEGLDIGSHTFSHRWLPHLRRPEVAAEVRSSRAKLEDLLQRPVPTFAYPMGGWNPAVRDEVEAAGYEVGVTVDRGLNAAHHDPIALRRAFAFDDPRDFRWQLEGAYDWMRPMERWRTRQGPR
ncbi:MAG: polysaccharide deacetylase family protein [Marmoricola sp.]